MSYGFKRLITKDGLFYKDRRSGIVTTEVPILSHDLLTDIKMIK